MPTYVYQVITEDGASGEQFEVYQSIKDPPLTAHPETGEPVERVIQPAFIGGKYSDSQAKKNLGDDRKLANLGFTKYVKSDKGGYEKAAGHGPDLN